MRLAAIHRDSFSRKDSSLPGSGNNASSLRPEPVAVPARPLAGYRQAEQRELRRQAHTHSLPEDSCRQADTRDEQHRNSSRNPADPAPDRFRLHSPNPHLRRVDGDDVRGGGAHDGRDNDGRDHALCRPTQDSRELR